MNLWTLGKKWNGKYDTGAIDMTTSLIKKEYFVARCGG